MVWLWILSPWVALVLLVFWDIKHSEGNWTRPDKIGAAGVLFNFLTFIGAVGAVAVAVYAYGEAKRQADAAEVQIDVAKDTAKRQLRGYVYVSNGPIENFVLGQIPSAALSVQMIGQTPAYAVRNVTFFGALPFPLKDNIKNYESRPKTESTKAVLFPGLKLDANSIFVHALTPEEFAALGHDQYRVFLWGEVSYDDAFGATHLVRYCYHYSDPLKKPGSAQVCDQHVEAD